MEHKDYKEHIPLLIYQDIDPEYAEKLKEHLLKCAECKKEYEDQLKIVSQLNREKFYAVEENLLLEARAELRNKIREEKSSQKSSNNLWEKLKLPFSGNINFALGSAFTLLIGILIGYLVFNKASIEAPKEKTADNSSIFNENVKIENVRLIEQTNNGEVEFSFDAVKPVTMKGNIKDQKVQSILAYSILNEQNPGSRLNSIVAIKNSFASELDEEVKEAILTVAQHDENSGVRGEALKLLREFNYDEKIKDALLFVLMNDDNSGNRIEAINNLLEAKKKGHQFDSKELRIFKEKMSQDENDYIKHQAKNVLEEKI